MRPFLDTHAALILRLSRSATREAREQGEAVDASDVAHEVMVTLLRLHRAGGFDPERVENVEGYLSALVRSTAERARKRTGVAHVLDGSPKHQDVARREAEARQALEALKASLGPRDALVLALFAEEGLGADEVATHLGATLRDVASVRDRILAAGRHVLGLRAPSRIDVTRGAT